ncbi:MAG: hypothetical protein WD696_11995 [Bryobacteraceae bacterium]
MQLVGLVWGILALLGMVVAFMPCLGALNWLLIPFAGVGLVIGVIAFASSPPGHRGPSVAGIVCCSIATMFGLIRLILGAGIL